MSRRRARALRAHGAREVRYGMVHVRSTTDRVDVRVKVDCVVRCRWCCGRAGGRVRTMGVGAGVRRTGVSVAAATALLRTVRRPGGRVVVCHVGVGRPVPSHGWRAGVGRRRCDCVRAGKRVSGEWAVTVRTGVRCRCRRVRTGGARVRVRVASGDDKAVRVGVG